MIPTLSQKPYILPEGKNQQIFEQSIRNIILPFSTPSSNPCAVFLGGQSGSGKSGLAKYIVSTTFSVAERAVIVNSDTLREFHPYFAKLQKSNPHQASFLVNPDTLIWQQKLIDVAIKTRRNLLFDGTLGGNSSPILATMAMLRKAGYYVQASILAVPARLSRFGIYKRYEDQVALKGIGRWVGMDNHDKLYQEIPQTVKLLEVEKAIDAVQIFRRQPDFSPVLFYHNCFQDDHWQYAPTAANALAEGRNYPWSDDEQHSFLIAVHELAEQMRQRGVSEDEIATFYRYVECTH